MPKFTGVTLRLLGAFALDANVGRPIAISIRSKKARALLAYLAMQPNHHARREALATLLWGDYPDVLARHSLRQCLISLRRDLCLASEILTVDRETVGLRPDLVTVDARTFMSLAGSSGPDDLARAAELWSGSFLADVVVDVEEFSAWHRQENDRLSVAAAGVFAALCHISDDNGDGDHAIAAAERLVALDPTREDRQRIALELSARHRGREAALSKARVLTDLLHGELGVAPEPATRALIDAIRRGDFEPAPAAEAEAPTGPGAGQLVGISNATALVPVQASGAVSAVAPSGLVATHRSDQPRLPMSRIWRIRPLVAASASIICLAIGTFAMLERANGPKLALQPTGLKASHGGPLSPLAAANRVVAVFPFTAQNRAPADDPPVGKGFAQGLTHDLIGYLSRFGNLRVIAEPTSELYRDRPLDANLLTEYGVRYAVVGHVQGRDNALRIDFQLVDAATQTNVWSNHLERERDNPTLVADEAARGIARALAIEIDRLAALALRAKPAAQLTDQELVERGYLDLQSGGTRENVTAALKSFDAALQRNPRYQPAMLAAARTRITAVMNFVDLDPAPDLGETERQLNAALAKFPNSISALYSLALLQKHRHQYQASLRLLQRCLELNPSFLPALGQIGDVLVRSGEPEKGLEKILQTLRLATSNDPTTGYWYLFAAEAELELGHGQAAIDWALRANTFMPGSALVQAWLASIYATVGDRANAARYVTALMTMAPDRIRSFLKQPSDNAANADGSRRPRIIEGLRLALGA
jgi:DNA-binding SARP family transcriptional activator/TolB-like protein